MNQNFLDFVKIMGKNWSRNITILMMQGRKFKKCLCILSYYPNTFQASSIFIFFSIFLHCASPISLYNTSTRRKKESLNVSPLSKVFTKKTSKRTYSKTGILSLIKFVCYISCNLTYAIHSMPIDILGVFIPPTEGCVLTVTGLLLSFNFTKSAK